jgi:hypothetical protein
VRLEERFFLGWRVSGSGSHCKVVVTSI